jgi:hypothetical protein
MTLYTMSGKRTTIEERDSTTEEERMAEVRARLFTLFDDDDEKEREYAEQNGLKNRATGTFQKIKDIIGDGDDENTDEAVARNPAKGAPENKTTGAGSGAERRKPVIPEQRRRRDEDPGNEQPGKKRIEQERRVRPVNPVRAMDAEKFEKRGRPEPGEGDRARRASEQEDDGRRARRPSGRPASGHAEPVAARSKPKDNKTERPAAQPRQGGYDQAEAPQNKGRQPDSSDESFRLGDLFKDKEPDIFSRWEQEDETEKRIRERRERRRAEIERRGRGDDDDSKMKTAAALFIAREGMKNFFGKFSGSAIRDQEQDDEEKKAEEALRELAAARITDGASTPGGRGTTARAAADDDDRRVAQKTDRSTDRELKEKERSDAKPKTKSQDESESKKRTVAAVKDDAPQRGKRAKDDEQQVIPKRSKKRAAPAEQTSSSDADTNTAATRMRAARPAAGSQEKIGDDARPESSLLDYLTGGARFSRSAIAWMAGGAAGSVAVVVIAIMIVNSHMIGI